MWAAATATGWEQSRSYGIAPGPGNSLYLCGTFADTAHFQGSGQLASAGAADAFLVKMQVPPVTSRPESTASAAGWQVYPNPITEAFTVRLPAAPTEEPEIVQAQLLNTDGKIAWEGAGTSTNRLVRFQPRHLTAGMYVLRLSFKQQVYHTRLVIIP